MYRIQDVTRRGLRSRFSTAAIISMESDTKNCNFGLPLNESVKNNIKSVLKPFKIEAVQNWQSSASKSMDHNGC